jgi:hypothetical protein
MENGKNTSNNSPSISFGRMFLIGFGICLVYVAWIAIVEQLWKEDYFPLTLVPLLMVTVLKSTVITIVLYYFLRKKDGTNSET